MLAEVDPVAAGRLTVADHVRVLRALEVFRLTGRSIAEWQADDERRRAALGELPPMIVVDVGREELERRIVRRVDAMLSAGWLGEARRLHALDLPEHSPARKALGYRALFDVLDGRATIAEARERIILATRQFARRQRTWFRRERDARFLEPEAAAAAIMAVVDQAGG
jgi:tRNA dimethylallyltransferase